MSETTSEDLRRLVERWRSLADDLATSSYVPQVWGTLRHCARELEDAMTGEPEPGTPEV